MTFRKKISLIVVLCLGVLLVALPLILSAISWNFARPWISQRVSSATERSFNINGNLNLSWQKPDTGETGWQRWIPWPHLRAHEVALGNPAWASTGPTMASVPQVDFNLNPLALFQKSINVSSLILTEPKLILELGPKGQNNWTFKQHSPSSWKFTLQDLWLNQGTVRLVDPLKQADVTTRIDTLKDGSITWKISGKLAHDTVSGDGQAGALLSLQSSSVKYPLSAHLKIGKTEMFAKGTLTNPRHLSQIDVQLKLLGASMGQLFPFSGIVLPETPRFSTQGRLFGSLATDNFHLTYDKFTGEVGSSDLAGTLEYRRQKPRPLLRGALTSNLLNLKDLGALVGTGSSTEQKNRNSAIKQPVDKALPVAPFRTERWDQIDAEVQFTGKKIVQKADLPIENVSAKIVLQDGKLTLAPLNFGVAGGNIVAELNIDGKQQPPQARMTIHARRLQIAKLFPHIESMRASLGQLHGNAKLTGTGNSFATLAASANGEVKAFVSEGTVSKYVLEAMGLNIGSIVISKIFGDHQVKLNCLASDFSVTNGLMQTRVFVVDTDDAIINVEGRINLANEQLALTIHPETKGFRLLSLRSPLYIKGSFKHPDVGVDKGAVALRAGAAIALGTLAAPFAALLALVNTGPDEDSPCTALLAQARKAPLAPAPGRAATKTKPAQSK